MGNIKIDFIKLKSLLAFIILCFGAGGCNNGYDDQSGLNCDILHQALISQVEYDESVFATIKAEIDKLTNDLEPKPTVTDPLGHLANFDVLFERLGKCEYMTFEINCYGCIQTGYPQTEVMVEVDSSGTMVKRIFDFYTSERLKLTLSGVHNNNGLFDK